MTTPNLDECLRASLETYFADLKGDAPTDVYAMVLRVVERPLLELVMQKADHNQSRAAQWLGINRNTLHKKLVEHGLVS